ncbi:hypothetical protein L484_019879 [Morus notabilis]|uniref:Putative gamma-glutamylcyclotransferase n=1 Tax=Morus notabilis TaxID=981085 RepID=W9S9Z4_9ROSA|nr:hypothetical protein L484_019879 [Morus notabilis]
MSGIGVGGSQSQSLHNVFVYGSLLADDVVRVLLNRLPLSSFATLNSFHRYSIKGRVYPAILPVENKRVNGRSYGISLDGVVIGTSRKFRYLGSIVQCEGDIDEDIGHRIKAGGLSGRMP